MSESTFSHVPARLIFLFRFDFVKEYQFSSNMQYAKVLGPRFMKYRIHPKYWDILTPYHICPKI